MYPTSEHIEQADHYTLGVWVRRLPSPGSLWIGKPEFEEFLEKEVIKLNRILERFEEMGGWNPGLSKAIGW